MCCMCVAELIIKGRSYFLGDPSKTELMRLIRCFGTHIIPIHISEVALWASLFEIAPIASSN